MNIASIGIFGNPARQDIVAAIAMVRERCAAVSITVLLSQRLADLAGQPQNGLADADLVEQSDLIIAFGGDGSMLHAARAIARSRVPLFGINLGSLGYLTDVPFDEFDAALEKVLSGQFQLDGRARVYGSVWRGDQVFGSASGLNDLVVNMGSLPRALDLELRVDDESLGRFLGDGMIFSTPTGSTAYNLSAGGSVCHPGVHCLLLAPICPHSLGMRPLILSNDIKIELVLHNAGEGATLTADGQTALELESGDRLSVHISDPEVMLVKFPQSDFFRVMHHKLNWGASPRRRRDGG